MSLTEPAHPGTGEATEVGYPTWFKHWQASQEI